jgi:hypothetical protein
MKLKVRRPLGRRASRRESKIVISLLYLNCQLPRDISRLRPTLRRSAPEGKIEMRRMLGSWGAVAMVLGVVACGPGGGDGGERQAAANADEGAALDVNDVSLLFPLVDAQGVAQEANLLSLRSPGLGGPLLSDDTFAAVLASAAQPDDPAFAFTDPGAWKVVGVRADDCAKLRADDAACVPQLRLIAQPVAAGTAAAQDQALHLVFNVPAADFDALVDGLVALKKSSGVPTNGVPLGVHPAMAVEGAAGPFATGLKRLVAEHAGPANLFAVASMLTVRVRSNAPTEWRFSNGVLREGAFVRAPLPCVDPAEPSVSVFGSANPSFSNFLSAPAVCADDLDAMIESHPGDAFPRLTPAEQQPAVDAQLRADDPTRRAFAELRCPTCHAGDRALARVRGAEFLEAGFDQNPNRFVPPEGVTAAFRSGRLDPNQATPDNAFDITGPYEVRAFGYFSTLPSYTMRTVNETALVVDALNKKLAARPAPTPGGF